MAAMSDFVPFNEDHAIQTVTFSVTLDQPFDPSTIERVVLNHHRWKAELPAIQFPPLIQIDLAASTPVRRPETRNAVMFAFLRPDGTPAWVLRLIANEIAVDCSRYTRWDRIWGAAYGYIKAVLEVVGDNPSGAPERKVRVCSLTVIDAFRAKNTPYNLGTLFSKSDYVPKHVFKLTGHWHMHSGWFESSENENENILQNLNIQSQPEPVVMGAPQSQSILLSVMHLQQTQFSSLKSIIEFGGSNEPPLKLAMQAMHARNKRVLIDLLTSEMAARIGLVGGSQ